LLSTLQSAFAKAINTALPEQQNELRTDMSTLRSSWEQLSMDLNTIQAQVKSIIHRWEDFYETRDRFEKWLDTTEDYLKTLPDTKGKLGEMKMLLEKYKHIIDEVQSKKSDLDHLMSEADELANWAKDNAALNQVKSLNSRWESLKDQVDLQKDFIEDEIKEYNAYHAALQETEKWFLRVSLQLLVYNSLYIISEEQFLEEIKQHQALLNEIQNYENVLDDLKAKGQGQIDRYEASDSSVKPTIITQLQHVRDSYNCLLDMALQFDKRLNDSLAKFREFEKTLESITKNLEIYEPEVEREQQAPLDTLESAQDSLIAAKALYNKLQGEKARLIVAVEAYEAAAACVARPGSPLDVQPVRIPDKEMDVRAHLEELIDQVFILYFK
jgi:nesprin-1